MSERETEQEMRLLALIADLPRWKQRLLYRAFDRIVAGEPVADVQRWLADRFAKGEGKGRS